MLCIMKYFLWSPCCTIILTLISWIWSFHAMRQKFRMLKCKKSCDPGKEHHHNSISYLFRVSLDFRLILEFIRRCILVRRWTCCGSLLPYAGHSSLRFGVIRQSLPAFFLHLGIISASTPHILWCNLFGATKISFQKSYTGGEPYNVYFQIIRSVNKKHSRECWVNHLLDDLLCTAGLIHVDCDARRCTRRFVHFLHNFHVFDGRSYSATSPEEMALSRVIHEVVWVYTVYLSGKLS